MLTLGNHHVTGTRRNPAAGELYISRRGHSEDFVIGPNGTLHISNPGRLRAAPIITYPDGHARLWAIADELVVTLHAPTRGALEVSRG